MRSVSKQYARELAQAAKLERELKAVRERAKSLQREERAQKRKEEKDRRDRYAISLGKEIAPLFYDEDPASVKGKILALKQEGKL